MSDLIGNDDILYFLIKIKTLKFFLKTLCQNTNPLGESLEFLNDDIK